MSRCASCNTKGFDLVTLEEAKQRGLVGQDGGVPEKVAAKVSTMGRKACRLLPPYACA